MGNITSIQHFQCLMLSSAYPVCCKVYLTLRMLDKSYSSFAFLDFQKLTKYSFRNTIRVSNSIHPAWTRGYKTFLYSTQLSTKFILLINVKMPTIVGILTFISMINTTSERLKARNFFICQYFSFYEQLKFHAQLSSAQKKL